jgi:hypothetical protein
MPLTYIPSLDLLMAYVKEKTKSMAMKLLLASEPSEQEKCQIIEEFYLLGHNATYSTECQLTLNMEAMC